MWNRSDLKRNAKLSLSRSYWRSVLAALMLSIGVAGFGGLFHSVARLFRWNGWGHGFSFQWDWNGVHGSGMGPGFWYGIGPYLPWIAATAAVAAIAGIVIHAAVKIFVCGPLEVGAQRWFIVNKATGSAASSELLHPFSHSYMHVVKTIFLRDLYLFLWNLLFVIPGIVKSYSYRLVPYIMAESPEMDTREAFRLSRAMMDGNKWRAFVLDLSFLGWEILNACTFGILGFFYVSPYRAHTNMELYIALRDAYLGRNQSI